LKRLSIKRKIPTLLRAGIFLFIYVQKGAEIEQHIKDNFEWREGDTLENMWMNGEALVMFVDNGEMKIFIR
jgi:hypothetical protein